MVLEFYDLDTPQSIREFERAIELNPNYATAHHWFGSVTLLYSGQFDRAFAEMKRALELDPFSVIINADVGVTYIWAHRYDEAIAPLRRAIELDPGFSYAHWYLGQAFDLKGELREAIAEYQKAVELSGGRHALALLGQAQAKMGNRDEALKILRQLQETAKRRYVADYDFALLYLALGDKTQALDWLEKTYQDHSEDIALVRFDPFLDPLRGEPRFEKLVARMFGPKNTAPEVRKQSP